LERPVRRLARDGAEDADRDLGPWRYVTALARVALPAKALTIGFCGLMNRAAWSRSTGAAGRSGGPGERDVHEGVKDEIAAEADDSSR
jgi:hypothetical protein